MSNTLLFTNARLIDPETRRDEIGDLLVVDGEIAAIGPDLGDETAEVIDCGGKVLCPGLIDMRVFVGEPGMEFQEDFTTASAAAAAGGVTTLIIQPNTEPVIDSVPLVDYINRRSEALASVHVKPMAAMTKGTAGGEMAEIGMLAEAGAVAFTDGDQACANSLIMRRIMDYARGFDALIVHHIQDPNFKGSGVMNEGEVATRLGLPGIPDVAETMMLERDLRLVELTGCRYHAGQISCAAALKSLEKAKTQGLPVSASVSAHHFALNENDIGSYRTFTKTDPPLRSEEDRQAMVRGLADGTIDVIVSSHDPQDPDSKRRPFAESRHGCIGLETLLPLTLELVHKGELDLIDALAKMTINPAKLLDLASGRLAVGAPADLILIDPDVIWVVVRNKLKSKSTNTAFEGRRLQGRAVATWVAGDKVYELSEES